MSQLQANVLDIAIVLSNCKLISVHSQRKSHRPRLKIARMDPSAQAFPFGWSDATDAC